MTAKVRASECPSCSAHQQTSSSRNGTDDETRTKCETVEKDGRSKFRRLSIIDVWIMWTSMWKVCEKGADQGVHY